MMELASELVHCGSTFPVLGSTRRFKSSSSSLSKKKPNSISCTVCGTWRTVAVASGLKGLKALISKWEMASILSLGELCSSELPAVVLLPAIVIGRDGESCLACAAGRMGEEGHVFPPQVHMGEHPDAAGIHG